MRLTYDVVHEVWDVAVDGGRVWQPDCCLAENLGQRPLQRPRKLLHRTALCCKRTCRQNSHSSMRHPKTLMIATPPNRRLLSSRNAGQVLACMERPPMRLHTEAVARSGWCGH